MSMLFVADDTSRGQLIDLAHGTVIRQYAVAPTHRFALTFCPYTGHIAVFQRNSCAVFLSPHSSHVVQRSFTGDVVTCCAASPCGTFIFAGTAQGNLLVWNVRSGELLRNCKVHLRAVTCLALSSDAALLATASEDAESKVWGVAALCTFRRAEVDAVCTFAGHTLAVLCCAFLHHAPYIVTGSADKTCRMYDAATGSELQRFVVGDEVTAVAVCTEDERLVAGTRAGALYFATLTRYALNGCRACGDQPGLPASKEEPLLCQPNDDGHHSPIVLLHYAMHSAVLSVSENGSVLWHDAIDGSLRHECSVERKMRIGSCCLVPARAIVTDAPARRAGLSKNAIDSSHGVYTVSGTHCVTSVKGVSCTTTRMTGVRDDVAQRVEALRRQNDELEILHGKLERRLKRVRRV